MPITITYSGDPSASDVDAVRFEISDTDTAAPLLADAEIAWCILDETASAARSPAVLSGQGLFAAGARCLESLARRFAAQADTEVGALKVTYSGQAKTYAERARELRAKAQGLHAPYAGGLSQSEKAARQDDPDTVQPAFSRDQFRSPYTGPRVPQFPLSNEQPP